MGLTSFSLKRIAWPLDVDRMTLSAPPERLTHFNSSPGLILIAINPERLTFANSSIGVLLIKLCLFASIKYLAEVFLDIVRIDETVSSLGSSKKLTKAWPRAVLEPSGNS